MLNSKTNWTSNEKYNYTDINRVEENSEILATYLINLGYFVNLETNTNRTYEDFDFSSDFNRVESNIESLKNKIAELPGYISRKIWSKDNNDFSYIDANRWEINLSIINKYMLLMEKSFKYCGTFSCGEEVI